LPRTGIAARRSAICCSSATCTWHWHCGAGVGLEECERLLPVGNEEINKDRLYRGLDHLLAHKAALEAHLSQRCDAHLLAVGELLSVQNEVLLYDVTSTYFEGLAEANPQAQRGYSRDHRPDCKQVCIALVVTFDGFPLGYEVFAGTKKKRPTKLHPGEADISLAARSFHSVVLSLDKKKGPLKDAYEQGGKVVFSTDFDKSGMSLSDFIKAA
jgi:hypothetical protein